MSSITLSASPWTNSSTRKRTSTIHRKKTCRQTKIDDDDEDDIEMPNISENFESAIDDQDDRNSRVNQLLNKITDAGTGLADFVPIAAPKNTLADLIPTVPKMHDYSPNNSGEDRLSNYTNSYESGILGKPYYSSMGINGNNNNNNTDNTVMQKLNYITHILEDIQMEKTSNVTEELILYSFLGVFVIFVVDSFAKAGKYYR
jgi:hypothetical protein